jgi:hypothetical protein
MNYYKIVIYQYYINNINYFVTDIHNLEYKPIHLFQIILGYI